MGGTGSGRPEGNPEIYKTKGDDALIHNLCVKVDAQMFERIRGIPNWPDWARIALQLALDSGLSEGDRQIIIYIPELKEKDNGNQIEQEEV